MTVLVVEDTELLRRMYTDKLTAEGYRTLSAADGLEALSILRSDTPDLILLDLIMPKMSGLEVLELVKKDPRLARIPVLILSNLGQDEDMQRAIEMGAADYLIKNDVRPNDVAERINGILKATGTADRGLARYRLHVRDREGDSDALVRDAGLTRRFWCPACEVELSLELSSKVGQPGWYEAHFICTICGREY
jgi:DNA-binding response OmpR family regulator